MQEKSGKFYNAKKEVSRDTLIGGLLTRGSRSRLTKSEVSYVIGLGSIVGFLFWF